MSFTENEPAALGLAVSAKRLGQLAIYRAVIAKYASVYASIAQLERASVCETRAAYETSTRYARPHRQHHYRPTVAVEPRYPGIIGD
jgi:hypothetical protein